MSFQRYIRDSEHFYDLCCQAFDSGNDSAGQRLAIASVLFSLMAVESFINNMLDDFASLPEGLLTVHERGFLEERHVQFESAGKNAGEFVLTNRREYRRLEDKVLFLLAKFGGLSRLNKGSGLWQRFANSKETRDKLSHPRRNAASVLCSEDARTTLDVAKEIIGLVSANVWQKQIDL